MILFSKMHGLGNDFMVIDATKNAFHSASFPIFKLADRHTGVGFDQLLVIEKHASADFLCRIFNADGSEAEQCGNGLRCVARYVHEHQLITKNEFTIATKAGIFPVKITDYDHITVSLGTPNATISIADLALISSNSTQTIQAISLGNPHGLIVVDDVKTAPIAAIGSELSAHEFFPEGANIGFMQIINSHHIKLRTFERGVGETLACGSNACAAAVAGILNGSLTHSVTVEFQCGSLLIEWAGEGHPIFMTGPANLVYVGELNLH